jgi:Threonine aldolase
MDGARFANALTFLKVSPAEITWRAGVDILSFGATKNGALAAEAVVIFDKALAAEFAFRRKRAGHLFSKMRFLSAQLDAYLEGGLWLRNAGHANAMANRLAEGLGRIPRRQARPSRGGQRDLRRPAGACHPRPPGRRLPVLPLAGGGPDPAAAGHGLRHQGGRCRRPSSPRPSAMRRGRTRRWPRAHLMAEGSKRPSLGQIAAAGRRRLREAVDDCIDRPYLPQPPDDTDLFLVAYPKSGINWLKWLMATTNLLLSGDKREITFFNHSDFIADLHSVSRVGPPSLPVPAAAASPAMRPGSGATAR